MKKLLIISGILFTGIIGYSQNQENEEARNAIHEYFNENVIPFLIEQQEEYMAVLSDEERKIIYKLKSRNGNITINRNGGKQNHKQKINQERKDQIDKVVNAHKRQNEKYKLEFTKKIEVWKAELESIHKEHGIDKPRNGRGAQGTDNYFDRISKPQALLMWSKDTPMNRHSKRAGKRGKYDKSDTGNPEFRSEIRDYFKTEIEPVIRKERKSFDRNLTNNEKHIIHEARQKIRVRQEMFKSWYGSEEFEPGKRAKDPNFDGMREDMRESMKKVREIAENNRDEIRESFESMEENKQKWMSDLRSIAQSYSVDPRETIQSSRNKYQKIFSPVKFLLINPDDNSDGIFTGEQDARVYIYPNPFSDKSNIVITGSTDQKAEVSLFSQNGEMVRELYNGTIDINRFEIYLLSEGLKDKLYILNVKIGENVISRKIILE